MLTIDDIEIDEEIKHLIPPLTSDERTGLMVSLERDGYRDPLVSWNGILLDGHNRYEIYHQNHAGSGISAPDVVEMKFPDRESAKAWVIKNQLSRRNLNSFQRTELELMLEELIAGPARERMKSGKRNPVINRSQGEAEATQTPKTRDEIGKAAGVSGAVVQRVKKILKDGDEETKQQAREGKISINQAYGKVKGVAVTKTKTPPKRGVMLSRAKIDRLSELAKAVDTLVGKRSMEWSPIHIKKATTELTNFVNDLVQSLK